MPRPADPYQELCTTGYPVTPAAGSLPVVSRCTREHLVQAGIEGGTKDLYCCPHYNPPATIGRNQSLDRVILMFMGGMLLLMSVPAALTAPKGYRLLSVAASAGLVIAADHVYSTNQTVRRWWNDNAPRSPLAYPIPGLAVGLLTRAIVGKKEG